jgi:hypothetical protein
VHPVGFMLAIGTGDTDSVSHPLADSAAIQNCGVNDRTRL